MIKGYSSSYYVVTVARYLHEFKDDDDFRRDPTPELSLYLPDCVIGATDGVKFSVKGKDISSGKVGNAFHSTTELSFKAHTANDAEKWFTVLKDANRGQTQTSSTPASPAVTTPATEANGAQGAQPPAYTEKQTESPTNTAPTDSKSPTAGTPATETPTSPAGLERSASTATGHFHTGPGGEAVKDDEKKA